MSQRLKNHHSPSSLSFTDAAVEKITEQIGACQCHIQPLFLTVVNCHTTGKDQLAAFKHLIKQLKDNTGDGKSLPKEEVAVLCCMFLFSVSRHPMRRSVSTVIDNLSKENRDVALAVMGKMLVEILSNHKEGASVDELRSDVETISAFMENFRLGDEVVRQNITAVIVFLEETLDSFIEGSGPDVSPVEQTKVMHYLLSTLKTTVAVLQKCEVSVSDSSSTTQLESDMDGDPDAIALPASIATETTATTKTISSIPETNETAASINCIVTYSFHIISTEHFTLECQCAAALLIPSIFPHIPTRFAQLFIHIIHSAYKNIPFRPMGMQGSIDTGRVDVRRVLCEPIEDDSEMKKVLREVARLGNDDTEWNFLPSHLFDSICSFFDSDVGIPSRLVLVHALLVKLPKDFLFLKLCTNKKQDLFRNFFIDELVNITLATTNKNELVVGFKSLTFWIEKAREIISDSPGDDHSSLLVLTTEKVLPHLIIYVSHYVDTIRHNVNAAIKLAFTLLSDLNIADFDTYVSGYFTGVLTSRGHISMLINICQFVNVEEILTKHKDLPNNIVSLLSDVDLASHGCDLYAAMCKKHFAEIQEQEESVRKWSDVWINILYEKLNENDGELKSNIANSLIPSLLKINPAIVKEILTDIESSPKFEKVRTVLVFLRCLRGMKNYVNTTSIVFESTPFLISKVPCEDNSDPNKQWKKLLHVRDLKSCLTHVDDQVRLDALSLVCSSAKTTDPVDVEDMLLLRHFLCFNMSSENPSFRHQVITNLKKIVLRMFNHAFQLVKQATYRGEEASLLQNNVLLLYADFLVKLIRFIFTHLYKSAPYSQTSTTLGLLDLLSELMESHAESALMKMINFNEEEKVGFTTRLMQSFSDTYEPNRVIAINTFKRSLCFCSFPHLNHKEIFLENLVKLSSPKPDVSSIAAYYIIFLSVILKDNEVQVLYDAASKDISEYTLYFHVKSCSNNPVIVLLDIMLPLLKKQLQLAKVNLIGACQDAPLYGVLYCMRLLFQFLKTSTLTTEEARQAFAAYQKDLIRTGLEIIKVVSPYVSNEAPEGYLCDVSLLEIFNLLQLGDSTTAPKHNVEVEAHVARMLLVCCWRSMKEVSLMLGLIVSNFIGPFDIQPAPLNNADGATDAAVSQTMSQESETLHPSHFIMDIWSMFNDILLRSKHAGAYELASLGFIKLCSVLWSSDSEALRSVPGNAATSLVKDLVDPRPYDNAQVTRRSAGVPFYLEALCTTEPPIQDKQSFKFLMTSLTALCEERLLEHDVNKIVISLNILRAFYKNGKLGEDVFPFVSSGVVIAIQGFGSSKWAIRNSCTLLFSALLQRIFGVKKSKMTGREFFSRFPRLYCFLLDQAKCITDTMEPEDGRMNMTKYHPSLFPVLLLLTHLYPSTVETSNFSMRLDNFIPYVMRCGSSAVYKTRMMAARALVPLLSLENVQQLMVSILDGITSHLSPSSGKCKQKIESPKRLNSIHGSLLQFQLVMKRCFKHPKHCTGLKDLFSRYDHMKHLLLDGQTSDIIKSLYLDTLVMFLQNEYREEDDKALHVCSESVTDTLSSLAHSKCRISPGYPLFLRSAMHYIEVLFQHTPVSDWSLLGDRLTEHIVNVIVEKGNIDEYSSVASFPDVLVLLMSSVDDHVLSGAQTIMKMFINHRQISEQYSDVTFNYLLSKPLKAKSYSEVLSTFTLLLLRDENAFQYAPLIVEKNLEEMGVAVNDELRSVVVKFLVAFILQLDARQEVSEELSHLLDSSWQFIEESSKSDQCEACREEAVGILNLDPEESIIFISSPNTVYNYFTCAIKLLKDPSADIRDNAARTLSKLSADEIAHENSCVSQPSHSLHSLFHTRILSQLQQEPKQCMLYLLSLMLDIDFDKFTDGLDDEDSFSQVVGTSEDIGLCPLMQRFVVYEESKENPYYDLKEIWELSMSVLDLLMVRRPDLREVYDTTLTSVRRYYDHISKKRECEGWVYSQRFTQPV